MKYVERTCLPGACTRIWLRSQAVKDRAPDFENDAATPRGDSESALVDALDQMRVNRNRLSAWGIYKHVAYIYICVCVDL